MPENLFRQQATPLLLQRRGLPNGLFQNVATRAYAWKPTGRRDACISFATGAGMWGLTTSARTGWRRLVKYHPEQVVRHALLLASSWLHMKFVAGATTHMPEDAIDVRV